MQTLAFQLSSTSMQLLFSFDKDAKVEKTLVFRLRPLLHDQMTNLSKNPNLHGEKPFDI